MQLARVIGNIVCPQHDESLDAHRLLMIQPLDPGGRRQGAPLIATDSVGAGSGELVIFVIGKEASFATLPEKLPTDAAIVGIVDHVVIEHHP
ncbi:MAG TPA: EutN/CcmL family microcompartment protein [Acidobacteriota bacterium]